MALLLPAAAETKTQKYLSLSLSVSFRYGVLPLTVSFLLLFLDLSE